MDVVKSHKHEKKHKKSEKKKKRKRSHSSSDDSSNSDRKSSRNKKKKSKKSKKHSKYEGETEKRNSSSSKQTKMDKKDKLKEENESGEEDYGIPLELMNTKAKAPESKEEYEKRQSVVRKVYDEETGRHRLIKGDGEVIEEIVSKKAHEEINKIATQSDGNTFQNRLGLK